jgi:hypothetical protein
MLPYSAAVAYDAAAIRAWGAGVAGPTAAGLAVTATSGWATNTAAGLPAATRVSSAWRRSAVTGLTAVDR